MVFDHRKTLILKGFTMANQAAARPEAKETLPNPDPRYDLLAPVPQEWFRLKVTGQDLVGVIHGVKDWYVNDDFEFRRETKDIKNIASPIRMITGREFIGIPQFRRTGIYRKRWQWGTYFPKAEGEKGDPEYQPKMHEKEIISTFPFVSNYPLIFSEVDVQGRSDKDQNFKDEPPMTQIVFKTIVRVRMLRPRIALMQNTDWLGAGMSQMVRGALTDFVREKTYDDLVRKKGDFNSPTSEFRQKFVGTRTTDGTRIVRSDLNRSILSQYGVEITDLNVVDINANEEFEKQLRELANADIMAEILLRNARAKKGERTLQGEAEEAYIRSTANALKDRLNMLRDSLGGDLASLRAVEYAYALRDSKLTTLAGQGIGLVIGADGQIR